MFAALVLLIQLLDHTEVRAEPLQIQIPSQDQGINDVAPSPDGGGQDIADGDIHLPAHQDQGMDWLAQGPPNSDIRRPKIADVAPASDGVDQDPSGSDIRTRAPGPVIVDPIIDPIIDPIVTPDDTPDSGCKCRSMRRCVDCEDLRPCPGENRSEGVSVSIITISSKRI